MNTLRRHYPEYLMEAAGLGLFMISAAVFTTLLEHPGSPIHQAIAYLNKDSALETIPPQSQGDYDAREFRTHSKSITEKLNGGCDGWIDGHTG